MTAPLLPRLLAELRDHPELAAELRAALAVEAAPTAPTARTVYGVDELAAEAGMTPRGVRAAIARGDLRAGKSGGRWLITADAAREWVERTAVPAPRCPRPRTAARRGGLARALADHGRQERATNAAGTVPAERHSSLRKGPP